ncbi:MAG: CHASE4 domain-containing protein [Chloroflexota bacterium]
MSLRTKTFIIIGITLACLIAALYIVSQTILLRSYQQLETQSVQGDVQRGLNAVSDEETVMHATNHDWAHWDDAFQFMKDGNQVFLDANTNDSVFDTYQLNFMVFIDSAGKVTFQKGFDLVNTKEVPVPDGLKNALSVDGPLLKPVSADGKLNIDGVSGLITISEGAFIVASTPILPTNLQGQPIGSLVWGRLLDQREISSIASRTRLSIEMLPINDPNLPADYHIAESSITDSAPIDVTPLGADKVTGYTLLRDITNAPILIFRISSARSIYNQGQTSLSYFLIALLVLGVAFILVTLVLLERVILSRLAYLNTTVTKIRTSSDLDTRIAYSGKDELANLAKSINEMLGAMANAQNELLVARDQALEASQFKSQILANVSHDARTPLSVIKIRVEMLQKGIYGPLTDVQRKTLTSVTTNADQLLGFISNLLHEGQLESGKLRLLNAEFSPSDLMKTVENSMTPLANAKGLEVTTKIADDMPAIIYGDSERLSQILFNLVGNATKFTEQGRIGVKMSLPDPEHWAIEVSDTGLGIPLEAQDRIFEAFWQVDGTTTRTVNTGVGLGLSIVQQLTILMNGRVTVKSEIGSGSTFTVTLPLQHRTEEGDTARVLSVNR